MSVITRSTQVLHPDDRLARWYAQRHAYLNAAEWANQYSTDLQHDATEFAGDRLRDHRKAYLKLHTLLHVFGWVTFPGR